jgi:hypothetical protein
MIVTAVGSAWLLDSSIDKSEEDFSSSSGGRAALAGVRS